MDQLPREGRDVNAADLIESSIKEETSRFLNEDLPDLRNFGGKEKDIVARLVRQIQTTVVTSTLTSYVISYSTSTSTNNNLGAANGLSCLPSGFTLC